MKFWNTLKKLGSKVLNYPFIALILIYKGIFGGKKPSCCFYPSCSEYSLQAFRKYGVLKAFFLTIKRILKCHPWQEPQIDLLP